ncbi:MAG: type II toxin-antitoxin system VapC family toxin, partial [Tumebacillaceae bacterium]
MTVHAVDFGKSAVDLQSHVAFILDTNVVVAFLREDNPKHLAVHHFLHYLVNQDLQLFVTETVVHEVIHVLSRFFYAQSMLAQNHEHAHYSPAKQRELISRYERQFMSATKQKPSFTPAQKQTCRDILRQYNTLALRAFLPFLNEFCGFLPSSTEQMNIALDLCVET